MAIAFELVINFGLDHAAVEDANRLVIAHPPLTVGPHRIRLHSPMIHAMGKATSEPYSEMSIIPARVGFGVGLDQHQTRLPLTAEELSELGNGLYALLATFVGYRVAQVGWDPEGLVDPTELRQEWAEELAEGALPGLVLAEDLRLDVPMHGFVPFAKGYVWIPYEGERPSFLTADARRA